MAGAAFFTPWPAFLVGFLAAAAVLVAVAFLTGFFVAPVFLAAFLGAALPWAGG